MKTRNSQLSVTLFAAIALAGAVVGPLQAQESIIFSRPTENVTDKANSFMDQQTRKAPSSYTAPSSIFNSAPEASFDVLPGASRPKPLSAEALRQMQKNYDQSKNWTLMTPAEIMGVTAAERILGLPDPDKNLSTTERYFKRQEQQRSTSATNAMMRSLNGGELDDNPFAAARRDQKNKNHDSVWNIPDQTAANDKNGRTAAEIEQADRRALSPWGSAFNVPVAQKKSDFEIQAALERSRAASELSVTPAAASGFSAVPSRTPSSFGKTEIKPSPIANSYAPVRDTASRPVGVAPLPTINSARQQALTTPKPKPLTQPPPWVVSEDKSANPYAAPTTFQKRKF
jgi:hypothetical protein